MFAKLINFMKPLPDAERLTDEKQIKRLYRNWRIKMFFGMYFGYALFYFTRKNLDYVKPALSENFGLSIIELGYIGTTIYLTYGIGKFLSGVMADRCNIRGVMALGLFASSLINLAFPFLPQFHAFLGRMHITLPLVFLASLLWGLNGVCQSMGFPPVAKGLVYWFSPSERATKWTLWSSSHTFGAFFVGVLIAYLLKFDAWRMAFVVPAIMGICYSIFLLFFLTDKPTTVGLPPIEEYRHDVMPVKEKSNLSHWEILKKHVLKNPFLWALAISYIFIYYVRFATLDWGTMFLTQERGFSDELAVSAMKWMPFLGMPGGIVAGYLADRWFQGRCTQMNIIYLVILAASCWGFYKVAGTNQFFWTSLLASFIGFFVDGPQNLAGGVQASRVTVQESVSAACGFTGMFGYFGAMLSSTGAAFISKHYGWQGVYFSCIIACIIAMACIATTWRKESAAVAAEQAAANK
ncbi:MAG: MFS transporter [Elusimicrobiaceae bacterium]|uniref:MFS transporter n=1 Tax=Candidatus Avelusimicrobium faecicola TaxID=3416205 RepID=UPI002A79600C|nr:MFS transporter [Spirochaetota bacterium]MDY2940365.1 MFS transporter [Elusimicrobiaceae bacterium]